MIILLLHAISLCSISPPNAALLFSFVYVSSENQSHFTIEYHAGGAHAAQKEVLKNEK